LQQDWQSKIESQGTVVIIPKETNIEFYQGAGFLLVTQSATYM
jgi:hypothetical protein